MTCGQVVRIRTLDNFKAISSSVTLSPSSVGPDPFSGPPKDLWSHMQKEYKIAAWRWYLLGIGWALLAVSLCLPGSYSSSTAWRGSDTNIVISELGTSIVVLLEPLQFLDGNFIELIELVTGALILVGCFAFLASPLRLLWYGRKHSARRWWWIDLPLLSVWIPPLIELFRSSPLYLYLYGYYVAAIAWSLVFVATLSWEGESGKKRVIKSVSVRWNALRPNSSRFSRSS